MKTAHTFSVFLILIFLAACSGAAPASPTVTPVDVQAVQTSVVETIVADITQTALAQPTQTSIPPTETPVPPPTETPLPEATPTAQECDNSAFISDASVTDGTIMAPGQDFVKTWKVKNTGTCTWTTSYRIVFGYANPPDERMGGLPTPLTVEVAPNAEVEISINLKAPLKSGNYSGYWRLSNGSGYAFGEYFSVAITIP